jgi:tetratricopeptide (TPR) repeat protein
MSGIEASEYLNRVKRLLQRKSQVRALDILKEGLDVHPENAFLLSYYGALLAIVAKDYRRGVRIAEQALKQLVATVPMDVEAHYPTFYLNIARAYLAGGDRTRAILALKKGLRYDRLNADLLETMDSLGVRRRPPIPSLQRTHLLNKYIGLLLHKLGK